MSSTKALAQSHADKVRCLRSLETRSQMLPICFQALMATLLLLALLIFRFNQNGLAMLVPAIGVNLTISSRIIAQT